ncbi:MAG: 50S ribosomal protein P1 [Candidatus Diapherotrites archaeon]|nr:50S ribosomal protein P1 [Candidatus Diapherotrites archaeon]
MEYVYAALLLHEAKQEINEENLKKVLTAAGVKADEARVKALVASLDGVNIDEAISKAAVAATPVTTAAPEEAKSEEKEEKPKEEEKTEEEAAEGLSSLFG